MHGEKSKGYLWHCFQKIKRIFVTYGLVTTQRLQQETMMKQEIKLRDTLDWNQLLGMSKAQQVEFGVENLLGIYLAASEQCTTQDLKEPYDVALWAAKLGRLLNQFLRKKGAFHPLSNS